MLASLPVLTLSPHSWRAQTCCVLFAVNSTDREGTAPSQLLALLYGSCDFSRADAAATVSTTLPSTDDGDQRVAKKLKTCGRASACALCALVFRCREVRDDLASRVDGSAAAADALCRWLSARNTQHSTEQ